MTMDPRLAAFCSRELPECFHSVIHESEIWKRDPFDVESIHYTARDMFERLINQVNDHTQTTSKIWLIKGDAGAGKTHLMRAFRNRLHDLGLGYFGYMQMTVGERNYSRYILKRTLDSLDKPYRDDPTGSASGLMRLSQALTEQPHAVSQDELRQLREGLVDPSDVAELVFTMAARIVALDRFRQAGVDHNLIRALLFLQYDDVSVKQAVMSYLRCEDLSAWDQRLLGDLKPHLHDDAPQYLLENLASLIAALENGVLVICLDQLEYLYEENDPAAAQRFRNALQTVDRLITRQPGILALISCLDDYYEPLSQQLTRSMRDRIERESPVPIPLDAYPAPEAITALITCRLEALYETCGVHFETDPTLYPFPEGLADALQGQRFRDVLTHCQRLREQSQLSGQVPIVELGGLPPDEPKPSNEPPIIAWDQRWNDFFSQSTVAPPDDDAGMQQLLAETIEHCSDEQPYRFKAVPRQGGLAVDTGAGSQVIAESLVGLCNKSALGGALAKQVAAAAEAAGQRTLIIARSTAFPANPKTKVARQIAELLMRGARRTVIEDSDWRAMAAMHAFREQYAHEVGFDDWLARSQPLSLLPSLKTLLSVELLPAPGLEPPDVRRHDLAPEPPPIELSPEPHATTPINLGLSRDYKPQPVTMDRNDLCRHAAFLGGSGSGKTTLALSIVEQLLEQGVPAILVDRKGDLANYARRVEAGAGNEPLAALLSQLDVALYTPGQEQGRTLNIPIVPAELGRLQSNEREQMADYAARALGSMMNYKPQGLTQTRLAILKKAIGLLAELRPGESLGLDELINFIAEDNPDLIYAIGQLDPKHFKKLVQELETLRLMNGALFSHHGEMLDCAALLGLDGQRNPGRTRLTVINTSFLGDTANVLFWVTQLLLEIGRYASRRPSDRLQCLIMLDEADLYLPANSKPPTKEPLENLLRRARSAGIGLLLATQSPGDLDYKSRDQITTWFLGRIREQTALNKLRPMLNEARSDIEARLPSQEQGKFYLIREGQAVSLKARRCLIRAEQLPEEEIVSLAKAQRE